MTDIITAIDLGSVRCGVARGPSVGPPRVDVADIVTPCADDNGRPLRAAVDALAEHVRGSARCILEIAPLYMPAAVTPQAATSMANAHAACERIADAVAERCAAMVPPVPVVRVPRQQWAHRLIPHRSGGIPQPEARAAVLRWLDGSGSVALPGDDRIDAAGAYLWSVLPALPRARKIRKRRRGDAKPVAVKLTKEQRRLKMRPLWRERWRKRYGLASAAERLAVGCVCPGKHVRGCALRKAPRVRGLTAEGIERARAALAGMMPRRARA